MTNKLIAISNRLANINGLTKSTPIPERTRSLLWITEESPSNIQAALMGSIYMVSDSEPNDYFSEPSLIWTKLPVVPNKEMREGTHYYPSYLELTPNERYQYLSWLTDITQPTNLSYAFLYSYGLERHLWVGDYDSAVDEMKMLLGHHTIQPAYYADSLLLSSLARNRLDIVAKIPSVADTVTDALLALRIYKKLPMTSAIAMGLAGWSGYNNKRYMELRPELFNSELQKNIDELERKLGVPFFSLYDFNNFPIRKKRHFTNISLEYIVGDFDIPGLLGDKKFKKIIYDLLDKTHKNVRIIVTAERGHSVRKVIRQIQNPRTRSSDLERLNNIIEQLVAKCAKSSYAGEDASRDLSPGALKRLEKRTLKIWSLGKDSPIKSNKQAFELLDSGYRTPLIYNCIAANYRRQKDYKSEVELLIQMKKDFGYTDHDSRIRSALRLLEKNRGLYQ